MPVLRSREVIFRSSSPKPRRKRKMDSSPLPSIDPPTPSPKVVSSRRTSDASSFRRLGVSNSGTVGLRRSLRLSSVSSSLGGIGSVMKDGEEIERISGDVGVRSTGADDCGEKEEMTPRRRRFTAEEKGKRHVEVGEEKGRASGKYTADVKGRVSGKHTAEEKGKKKFAVQDEWLMENLEDVDDVVPEIFAEKNFSVEDNVLIIDVNRVDVPMANGENQGDSEIVGPSLRRIEDRNRALRLAKKFAVFRDEERIEDEVREENDADALANEAVEEWPGPWGAGEKILRDRAEGVPLRFGWIETSQVEIQWTPSKEWKCNRLAPSLRELSMAVLCENAAEIQSLEGVPTALCQQLTFNLCSLRKMDYHILELLVSGKPTGINVTDCSWASEDGFKKIFSNCDAEFLEVLKLDLCGRCMPDCILRHTLACKPNSLRKLTTVSLCGNYRLSDDGLKALACSAPMLRSVNLSQCSLLTSTGIINLVESLETVLRELVLDYCSNIDALVILPALKKLKMMEKLSVSGIQSVKDKFVDGLLSVHGPNMKVLGFAGCRALSLTSTKSIGETCLQLCDLDLRNLPKLNDKAIEHLARVCKSIKKLKFQDSDCSDEAIAAFLEVSGKCLQDLSLNNFKQVGHKTAIALSCHCSSSLEKLDLSFCRRMTDKALGLIVDHCSNLKILKLFGCNQVTDLFLDGHSNPYVEIVGLDGPILKCTERPELPGFL